MSIPIICLDERLRQFCAMFQSKVDMMETTIREFEPVPNTQTHVLVDSWSGLAYHQRAEV
jgi:hypothetical protein